MQFGTCAAAARATPDEEDEVIVGEGRESCVRARTERHEIAWRCDAAGTLHHFRHGRLWSDCLLVCRSLTAAPAVGVQVRACPQCLRTPMEPGGQVQKRPLYVMRRRGFVAPDSEAQP